MDIKERVEAVTREILKTYPTLTVEAVETKKINVVKPALRVFNKETKIGTMIPVNAIPESVTEFETFMQDIKEHIQKMISVDFQFVIPNLLNFDQVKNRITMRVINEEINRDICESVMESVMADYAYEYRILIASNKTSMSSTGVTQEMMDTWGVTMQELREIAISNMKQFDISITPLSELLGIPDNNPSMFVVNSNNYQYGATFAFLPEVQETIYEIFNGREYYILPSSVYETIIIDSALAPDITAVKELAKLVREVNNDDVIGEEEFLSNTILCYDGELKVVFKNEYEIEYDEEQEL